ncbi:MULTISPECIES: response regulator [Aquitalea]|uniref:Chemotaxis regulator n=1 Tax=Aquitalea magnusonii TaxID=332411 RepID=A0A3G9GF31_9NEIS|nr:MULTISPECIES: response regulator [Aquitalea]NWK76514.1 response regulator [Aquitalea sp. LB_tupeE]BBF84861.1 chemotaxis regulator [Aquitalea magnusonii]
MKRVLIVDDAATVRLYHRKILTDAGLSVDEAVNGIEALEKAMQSPYDLYIVDINMPKMDGYTFVRTLRADLSLMQSPAIMVSTESKEGDVVVAYMAGANGYIIKPAKPVELTLLTRLLLGEPD